MYYTERINKKNEKSYLVTERYKDPLTGKSKRASITFYSDTPRARKQAERDLEDKIDDLISERQNQFRGKKFETFADLRDNWFETWQIGVKPQTIERESFVIGRLSKILDDGFLLNMITPLLVKNCLEDYRVKYHSSHSTMQHIKCTLNKIFDYGVMYNAIPYSPSRVVKLTASVNERKAKKNRLNKKFLDEREVRVLLTELKKRRNKTYYDLSLFLIGTGCRIGEASALSEKDVNFEKNIVTIDKSLRSHDLKVGEFYLDTTKTVAGERAEALSPFVIEAIKRVISRNHEFDKKMAQNSSENVEYPESIFRTEVGSPITSHTFREVLKRINESLQNNCKECYGFEWTKNAVPHSFRHIHISVLRNDPTVPLKEVQERVGHVYEETTNGYTHLLSTSQQKSVEAINRFAKNLGILN